MEIDMHDGIMKRFMLNLLDHDKTLFLFLLCVAFYLQGNHNIFPVFASKEFADVLMRHLQGNSILALTVDHRGDKTAFTKLFGFLLGWRMVRARNKSLSRAVPG